MARPLTRRFPFWAQILLGLVLGVVLGLVARVYEVDRLTLALETIGGSFVTLLKTIVVPLVFLAVVVSVARLREVANAARLAAQTLLWFAITAAVSVVVGIALGLLTDPGLRTSVDAGSAADPGRSGSWLDFLSGIIPANILGLSASPSDDGTVSLDFNVLQIVVLAVLIGVAVLRTGPKAQPFLDFCESFLAVIQTVLWWIIRLSPLGTLGLIGAAVATYGWDLLSPLAVFTIDVYVGCALVLLVVYPVILRAHGLNPVEFYSGAWPALQLAFVVPLLGGHHAADPARHHPQPRGRPGVRLLRRPARRDHQDGRLRGDLPVARRDLRGAVLRDRPEPLGLPADRVRLGGRLDGHRRSHRRGRDADADAEHARAAARRCRAAAGHRPGRST